ncbi:MAG: ATP-binding protein [Phycisphaerales bacterium]
MSRRIGTTDWNSTPLGPADGWPQSLRTLVRVMLDSRYAMWLGFGPDLTFFYNDAYARDTLGKKHPWALGRPAREVWAEIWPDIGPRIEHVLRTGEATWDEGLLLYLERSGFPEETYHTFSYSPVYDDAGGRSGMFCVVTEETERVIAERRGALLRVLAAALTTVRREEDVFTALERAIPADLPDLPFVMTFLAEPGSPPRVVSRLGLAAAVGAPPGGFHHEGWPLGAVLSGREAVMVDTLPAPFAGSLTPRGLPHPPGRAIILPLSHQDQSIGAVVVGVNPHCVMDDRYEGFLRVLVGQIAAAIAGVRSLEEERRRAAALAELDRAKTTFFSNVSHEFRTPLTLLLGPLEDLAGRSRGGMDSQDGELVRVAQRNAHRLLKLVNDLLEFSRIEAGRTQIAIEPADLAAITTDLASVFRSAMQRAGLEFTVDCPTLSRAVPVDRNAWEKVVLNLLSNALKYTLAGSVRVTLREEASGAVLEVTDTGTGIPAAELPNLFTRFHRVRGARGRTHEGTGIGLSLVQELARLHGGSVSVVSEEGRGSTFSVSMPFAGPQPAAAGDTRDKGDEHPGLPTSNTLILSEVNRWLPESGERAAAHAPGPAVLGRVVLADDNADMREYVQRMLSGEGYAVVAVPDGRAALDEAERERPDLLLSDVMMPGLDGFSVLRAVRAHPELSDLAVILLSARAGEEAKVEGLERGADDYLVKPFSAAELKARVRANIEVSRLRRSAAERERALRLEAESERDRLQIVLGAIRDRFVVIDSEWRFRFASESWCAVTGYSREQAVGRSVWELFPHVAGTAWEARVRRVMASRQPDSFEFQDESTGQWWDVRVSPVAGGGVSQLALDITERRRMEDERRQLLDSERAARAEAERATRLKDEFLATLSHELRTPLNAITGWAHLLRKDAGDAERVRKGIEVIERNTRIQTQLIADLLDMSRIITGKMRLDVQRVELPVVVHAAIESVSPAAEAKGIRLQAVIEPISDAVNGDPARIQQIVWNLLSNAIKFTPKGGRVQVVLARVNSHVEITVGDTGRGIDPAFLPHVFDRFRQADSTAARSQGGLGIGLALVKQLAELHGGRVRARSDGEGQGATFVVELPLAVLKSSDEPREHPRAVLLSRDGTNAPRLDGLRVLVVDDEPEALDMVHRMLEDCHVGVTKAASAEAATALLEQHPFDIILSDIGMPTRDGYEFMTEVRRRGIRTPAAALTAFARTEDKTRALLVGYQAHIAKPVDPAELFATIAAMSGRIPAPPGEPTA